ERMRRHHTRDQLEPILSKISSFSNLKLGAVVIIGFPGETIDDVYATRDLLHYFDYAQINAFSPVPGTRACGMLEGVALNQGEMRQRADICRRRVPHARLVGFA